MNPENESYIKDWVAKGDEDLLAAQRLIETPPMLLNSASFHCQQAAEKYLKAFLISKNVEFEYTHNLERLLQQCGEIEPSFNAIDPGRLDDYAVKGRYPGQTDSPTIELTKSFFKTATDVRVVVSERMELNIQSDLVNELIKKLTIEELLPQRNTGKSTGLGL